MSDRILLVEDDERYAKRLSKNLSLAGYGVDYATSGNEALERLQHEPYDLLLSDIKMPGMSGLEMVKQFKSSNAEDGLPLPVIFLTSVESVQVAVDAMKEGAADYITKDADRDEILLRIQKVLNSARLQAENRDLRKHLQEAPEFENFVIASQPMKSLLAEIDEIADTGAGVLIVGETGVGKELIARHIHKRSPRADKPFIDVNCAAIPSDNLFQSEVFGHEKGAFTGAESRKRGKLEIADGGFLFLDEIGDMPLESQSKILRALETQSFERLGGNQKIQVDIAVIAATNKDLHEEVEQGRFRQDLLYRLDILRLRIPPLRERTEDIIPLVKFYFQEYAKKYRAQVPEITPEAKQILESYNWPGNIRELKNLVERIAIRNRNCTELKPEMLHREGLGEEHDSIQSTTATLFGDRDEFPSLEEIEKQAIVAALEKTGWVQSEAAKLLEISPDRMHSRIKKFGLSHPSWRTHK